jgi:SAM-dependent methyltransferase
MASPRRSAARGLGRRGGRVRRLYRWFSRVYDPFRALWGRWTPGAEAELDALFRERIGPGARILELAPGTGINLERLFRCAPEFGSYLGIDVSEEMLARARPRARGDARVALRLGDATDLSGLDAGFDFIVCTWLLSHLERPVETVRGALEKLAEGGTAVFLFYSAPRPAPLRALLGVAGRLLRARFVDSRPLRELPHFERLHEHASGMATLVVFRRGAS